MQPVQIGGFEITDGARPLVIAEIGINHNGDLETALAMVREAKKAGADIVKFQTHLADKEMLRDLPGDGEQASHVSKSLYDIMVQCHLSLEQHKTIQAEAERNEIMFLSTPFCFEAVDLLEELDVPAFKIGSGEVTNIPFLEYVASKKRPIILSTGTANWDEVRTSVEAIKKQGVPLVIMQCTSNYPTPYTEVNLGIIPRLRRELDVHVGLSDHSQGSYTCFGAVALGAVILEKHFTISRRMPGIDQPSSMEPDELRELVTGVHSIWEAGGADKHVNDEAQRVRNGFSESVVSIVRIAKGDRLVQRENIWIKRPGTGIPSYKLAEVDGKRAARDIDADTVLMDDSVEW